jgi:hypothetical protein
MPTRIHCNLFIPCPAIWVLVTCLTSCAVLPSTQIEDSSGAHEVHHDSGSQRQPEWSGQEAAEALEEALELGFPEPRSLLVAYEDIMALGDASCPGDETQLMGNLVPWEGCTSDSGVFYSGVASYVRTEVIGSTGPSWSAHLGAGFLLIDTQGDEFEGGGNIVYNLSHNLDGSEHQWTGQVEGTWVHEGNSGWLAQGVSASLSMGGGIWEGQEKYSVSGSLGISDSWLSLDDLIWKPSCGEQPRGTLGIRDPSGLWLWVELGDDCSGCGTGVWDVTGERAELCVDLSAIGQTLQQMSEVEPWW